MIGAREFLLYGPETSPEELEKALIRYDRKTEIIQTEKEKSNNKSPRHRDQPRRSEREKKPYNRYEKENRPSPCPEHRSDQRWNKGQERAERYDPKYRARGGKNFREQSRPRVQQNESNRGKGSYISSDKWERMSAEERVWIVAERSKAKAGTKIGQVRVESQCDNEGTEMRETKEVKVRRKRNQQRSAEGRLA